MKRKNLGEGIGIGPGMIRINHGPEKSKKNRDKHAQKLDQDKKGGKDAKKCTASLQNLLYPRIHY
jgi:hypothetical protein